jgi:8-oxo-dGTP diphosphatase
MQSKTNAAICFLINKDDEVLLTITHDRPGKITWNGIVSSIEKDNSVFQQIIKNIYKHTKISIYEYDLKQKGVVHYFTIDPDNRRTEVLTLSLFMCHTWRGDLVNATGTRPTWFTFNDIPYPDMFEDYKFWLPKLLEDAKILVEVYSKINPITHSETVQDVLIKDIL